MENARNYLDAAEIQKITGLGRSAVYSLLHADGCPSLTIGRRVLVREDLFHKWLDSAYRLQDTEVNK